HSHAPPLHLHSFPTRRSSDLYAVNAQRDPFRFAADYVYSNDQRWIGSNGKLDRIAQFFSSAWQNSPGPDDKSSYKTGVYNLDGSDRKSTRLNSSHVAISYAVF